MKNRDSVLLYLSMPILWARNGFAWLRGKTKPAIALLAAVTLLLSMVPTQAIPTRAANISPSGSAVQKGHYIYFGSSGQKWRVLDPSKTSMGSSGMFLLSENSLGQKPTYIESRDYTTNGLKQWCTDYYNGSNFTDAEKAAMLATTVAESTGTYLNDSGCVNYALTGDKLFLLSAEEVLNSSYFANDYARHLSGPDSSSQHWFTRTGSRYKTADRFVYVNELGEVERNNINPSNATAGKNFSYRPGFNLDTSKVLFVSAASGGKGNGLSAVSTSGNEWKLTLADGNSFVNGASLSATTVYAGQKLTLTHKSLASFSSDYTNITAALFSGDTLLYYGSINTNQTATSTSLTLPTGLANGSYTLKFYAEAWNGDYRSDIATGTPYTVSVTVTDPPHIHPVCGAVHTDVGNHTGTCADLTWTAWDGTTPLVNGGRYYLSKDVTIDSTLVISGTVSLCLNGKTLKYENASVQGSVIEASPDATLNLCNCSGLGNGRITGGNTDSLGGGVYVDSDATFNMFSGTISGNTAATGGGVAVIIYGAFAMYGGSVSGNSADDGGGVFSRGSFTMYGGSIADNTAANYGAGVYVNTTSAALSGASVIRYNYTGTGEQSNVYLNGSSIHKLTVGTLSEGASIGVTLSGSTGTFTNGGAAFKDKFFSDNSDYIVGVTGNHLMLARPVTLSFDGNGGTGSMGNVQVADGSEYTLPESGFTAPTGKLFKAWTIGDTEYAAGDTVTVSGDTTVKAVWENIPADAPEVATSNAHVDVTYGEYNNVQLSVTVTEKEGYEYTYQWFIETTIGNILSGPIDNATESAYTLPNDLPADNHGYRCRVTAKRTDNGEIAYTDRFFDIYVHNAQSSFTNAPEAKEDLRFNGQWQELVTPGTANGGTVQYLVTTEEIAQSEINNYTFSSDLPKAANIGTYYVWYKIAGDFNHDGTSATDYVTVTIGKAQLQKPAENDTEFVYNGQEQGYFDTASGDSDDEATNEPIMPEPDHKEPEEPDNDRVPDFTPNPDDTKSENGVFGNGDSDDDEGTTPAPGAPTAPVITFDPYAYDITGDTQTDAGTYTVTVTLKDTDHYEWADGTDDELTYDFVISRKPVNIRWGSTEFTYDGTPKLPTATTEDFVEGDAMTLTVTGARTTAGLGYTATAAITGDKADNYKLAGDATTTFNIQKAAQAAPTLGKTDETGEGKADGTIIGVDATMEYRVEGEYTYTAITGTKLENLAPGTYYVRVRSDANYDPSPDTVVTIAAAPKKQPAGSDENPKTGDPGTLWLWAALAAVSGLLTTLPRQKKQMR